MPIQASPAVDNLLFGLVGERLPQADEDKAYQSRLAYERMARSFRELSDVIEGSVVGVGRSLPPQVGPRYVRAMNLFVDDNGTNVLRDFADQLDRIADGRTQTSMDITEAKWQIIAEVVRLAIELAVTAILAFFSGGASAGRAAVARAQSRVVILTILDQLLSRTRLMPTLTSAFEEAFMTFVVRLAMMVAGPDGRRPDSFDWHQIGQDAAFGALVGIFSELFSNATRNIDDYFDRRFFNDNVRRDHDGMDDITSHVDRDVDGPRNSTDSPGPGPGPRPGRDTDLLPDTDRLPDPNRLSDPDRLPDPNRNAHRDGGPDGGGVGESAEFVTEALAEVLAELLMTGLMHGTWAFNWDTFYGSLISNKTGEMLEAGAEGLGTSLAEIRQVNTATVQQRDGDRPRTGTRDGDAVTTGTGADTDTAGGANAARDNGRDAETGGRTGAETGSGAGGRPRTVSVSGSDLSGTDAETSPRTSTENTSDADATGDGSSVPRTTGAGSTPDGHQQRPVGTVSRDLEEEPARGVLTESGGDGGEELTAGQQQGAAAPTAAPAGTNPATVSTTGPTGPTGSTAVDGHQLGPAEDTTDEEAAGHQPDEVAPSPAPLPSIVTSGGPAPVPAPGGRTPEHELWQRLSSAPATEHRAILDEIAARRNGTVPSVEEIAQRARVSSYLKDVPGVTVVVDDAANYGHQAAATMLIASLDELGYEGPIRVIAEPAVRDRLKLLVPAESWDRITWVFDSFEPGRENPVKRERSDHLVLLAASDRIDPDGTTPGEFLDFAGADQAIVLQPYAWPLGARMVLSRSGADATTTVTDLGTLLDAPGQSTAGGESDPRGHRPVGRAGLYRFHVPELTTAELEALIRRTMEPDEAPTRRGANLRALVRAVSAPKPGSDGAGDGDGDRDGFDESDGFSDADRNRDGRILPACAPIDLMPAYGMHNLSPGAGSGTLGTLAEGIHASAPERPSVILALGRATVDGAPRHTAPWLSYATLDGEDLTQRLTTMAPGDVLILEAGNLPQDVFRQMYRLGTLPAVLEGANTANLAQLLGRPYFSVLTKHTPYDRFDEPAANILSEVTTVLGMRTQWGRNVPDALLEALDRQRTALKLLDGGLPSAAGTTDGTVVVTVDEVQRLVAALESDDAAERIEGILGPNHPDAANISRMVRYSGWTSEADAKKWEAVRAQVGPQEKAALRAAVEEVRRRNLDKLQDATKQYSVAPVPEQVQVVADALRQARTPGTQLHTYFDSLARRARDPRNDQVLQALDVARAEAPLPLRTVSADLDVQPNDDPYIRGLRTPITPTTNPNTGAPPSPTDESQEPDIPAPVATVSVGVDTPANPAAGVSETADSDGDSDSDMDMGDFDGDVFDLLGGGDAGDPEPAESSAEDADEDADEDAEMGGFFDDDDEPFQPFQGALSIGGSGGGGPAAATPRIVVTRPVSDPVGASPSGDGTTPAPPSVRSYTVDRGKVTEVSVPDARISHQTLQGDVGLASYLPSNWNQREPRFGQVTGADTYTDLRPGTLPGTGTLVGARKPLSWQPGRATFFAAHGTPTQITLALDDGQVIKVSGRELGRFLTRQPGLGAPGRPLVLLSCSTGQRPDHGGLSAAQHVANVTGRRVYAPTTDTGTAVDSADGIRSVLHLDRDGTPGQWAVFTPEPAGAVLDALATAAGLGTDEGVTAFDQAFTLQFVRTLRDTFGPDAERGTDGPELLRGLAALNALRWNTPLQAPGPTFTDARMSAGLLGRVTRSVLGTPASDTPSPDEFRAVLAAAHATRTADPGARVEDLAAHLPAHAPSPPPTPSEPSSPPAESPASGLLTDGRFIKRQGGRYEVLSTRADGNCLFHAVRHGLQSVRPGGLGNQMSIQQLRNLVADALHDGPMTHQLNQADPVDTVLAELNADALSLHLGVPVPALTGQERQVVDALPAAQRAARRARYQAEALRPLLARQLSVTNRNTEALWRAIVDRRFPAWGPAAPSLADMRSMSTTDLVEASIRDIRMWNTPFFDAAPEAVGRALGVELVLVQDRAPDRAVGAPGGTRLHVHYNGFNHYSAVDVHGNPADLATGMTSGGGTSSSGGTSSGATAPPAKPIPPLSSVPSAPAAPSGSATKPKVHFALPNPALAHPLADSDSESDSGSDSDSVSGDSDTDDDGGDGGGTGPDPAAFEPVEAALELHRPPRLDHSMVPPPAPAGPVTFTDGSRLPSYLSGDETSYGHSAVRLRGIDAVVTEIGDRTHIPDETRAHLESALRLRPRTFDGEGYASPPFTDDTGRVRVLHVRTRPHGVWERFTDVHGNPVRIDEAQRSQVTTGPTRSVTQSTSVSGSLPLGPPSGHAGFGRIGGSLGYAKGFDYNLQNQTLSQVETRMWDGSHLHLDDVQYEVWFSGDPQGPARGAAHALNPGQSHFTFGVHSGLSVRLSDSETGPTTPGSAPRHMNLGAESDYRLVHTEGYGPVAGIREWALRRIGARYGSAAHTEVSSFFTTENFHRMADRLARGPVAGRQLLGEDARRPSVGAFVVERVEPGEAVLLSETAAGELRNTIVQTVKAERSLSKTYTQELNAAAGPSFDLLGGVPAPITLRGVLGAVGRYVRSATYGGVFGGSGGRRIAGRAKKVPTALYLVKKTVYVRATGDAEPTAFETWSLDRMTRTEARRHAGWDDGTTLRARNANPPFAPAYLTPDEPAVLGMSRPEVFTHADGRRIADPTRPDAKADAEAEADPNLDAEAGPEPDPKPDSAAAPGPRAPGRTLLEEFTDQVIRAAARRHPDMIAPLEELDPTSRRWSDPERYRLALQNTLTVIDQLSHHSMAGNLETITTTGLRIDLTGPGRFGRSHRHIWIDGTLTNRRYEGTQNDLIHRSGMPGTDRLDGSRSASHTLEGGFEARLGGGSAEEDPGGAAWHAVSVSAGPRWGRQKAHKTTYGAAASFEGVVAGAAPSHLHRYDLELRASSGGIWRPRNLLRGLPTLGLLGTRLFVVGEPERDLVGGRAGPPVRGRVLLSVPDEHTPKSDPHAVPRGGTAEPRPGTLVSDERLGGAQARRLATGDTRGAATGHDTPFGDHPVQTLGVGGHRELAAAVEDVMSRTSGNSWHFTRTGAPAHDAMLRPFQPPYLAAEFDQTSGTAGSRIGGLFGKGPYLNRIGALVHRTRVVDPKVISPPVKLETELVIGNDLQSGGAVTTTRTFTVAGGASYSHPHQAGPSLVGNYGVTGRWSRSRATTHTVTRTVTSEIDRDDEGHVVLVSGDTEHDVLGESHAGGVLAPAHGLATALRTSWAGRRLRFAADWLGHLPEKAAHELRLIRDRMGEVPRYTSRLWSQPAWFRAHPFGSYPVNNLDASEVLADFDRELRRLGVDDASRDRVHAMVTPRALKALREEMTGAGAGARTRIGGWGWRSVRVGARTAAFKVELVAGEPEFDRLDHSVTFWDTRTATETVEDAVTTARTKAAGVSVTQSVRTGDGKVPGSGPTYGESGSSTRSAATSKASARMKSYTFVPNEPHADYLTPYQLRLTLDLGDSTTVATAVGDVGRLREQVPLSLTVPSPAAPDAAAGPDAPSAPAAPDPLGPPTLDDGPPTATVWGRGQVTEERIAAWRNGDGTGGTGGNGAGTPFEMPVNGFHVRRVTDLGTLRDGADLAVAQAYGASAVGASPNPRTLTGNRLTAALRRARRTNLTRPGTASASALHDGMSNAALSAFFRDSSGPGGHAVPGLSENTFAGGSQGDFRLFARPRLAGAQLLTVVPDSMVESAERQTDTEDISVGRGGAQESTLGGQATVGAGSAGSTVPGLSGAVVGSGDTATTKHAGAEGAQLNVKPKGGRSFLFAVPTDWLGVAEVERSFKDTKVGSWLGRALGPLGYVKPGPQAVETSGHVLAWVREDVARAHGLITDTNYPQQVADAWTDTGRAGNAWVDADRAYWTARRAMPELRERHAEARRTVTAAKCRLWRALAADEPSPQETADARVAVRAALDTLRQARHASDAGYLSLGAKRDAAVAAAEEFHTVRAATDRLTRWHRLPEDQPATDPQAATVASVGGADGAVGDKTVGDGAIGEGMVGDGSVGAPPRRAGLAEPPAPAFTPPAAAKPSVLRPAYSLQRGRRGRPDLITSPEGASHALSPATDADEPGDGEGFYVALAEGLRVSGAARPEEVPTGSRAELARLLRHRFADSLEGPDAVNDPVVAELLEFTAPDSTDTFEERELTASDVDLGGDGSARRHEFEDSDGRLPLHEEFTAEQRAALAAAQLRRPGTADARRGWDSGAADLLPTLAARSFGVTVVVVREDLTFQEFAPPADHDTGERVTLYLGGGRYRAAVDPGAYDQLSPLVHRAQDPSDREPEAAATPVVPVVPAPRTAHVRAPWNVPRGAGSWRRDADLPGTLTDPDGTTYDLVEPSGAGNGFWDALNGGPGAPEETASLLTRTTLPPDIGIDPEAVFTGAELTGAGIRLDRAQSHAFRDTGDRLPADLRLTQRQRHRLVRAQLLAGRNWNEDTTDLAARTAAIAHLARITVVDETGAARTFEPPGASALPNLPTLTVFRRGREFLGLRPRPTHVPAPPPPPPPPPPETDPGWRLEAFRARTVTRDDVLGLTCGHGAKASWDLDPTLPLKVEDLFLSDEDARTLYERLSALPPSASESSPA
ncbi:hypothetical protein [Streptomyces sp. NPDC058579]|uniref:WXG100-like domain-containing protein n=1 Tax=Streptomyces sp. NPDC058579 TaxID=3346548 RepID=UPI00364C1F45